MTAVCKVCCDHRIIWCSGGEANREFDACNCDIRCVHLRYAVH